MKIDIEIDTETVQRFTDFLKHELDSGGTKHLLSLFFWQSKNVFGGLCQNPLCNLIDVSPGIAIFWSFLFARGR